MKQVFFQRKNALTLLTFFAFLVISNSLLAQRTASVSGLWSSTATWGGSSVPSSTDAVTINGNITVTVDVATATCASLAINPSNNNQTGTLQYDANGLGVLTIVGNLTIGGSGNRRGAINMTNTGTMKIGGSVTINNLITYTAGNGTFEYNAAGAQTVASGFSSYNNLTLSGSGVKTITGITVNGKLSMQGTATATGSVTTYGAASTLEYKGSSSQTTGSEFPSTFSGTGGLIVDNSNGIILNANRTVANNVTFTNGKITTNAFKLSLTKATPLTAIVNSSSSKYVVGNLEFTFPAGTTTGLVYPIGTSSIYAPYTMTITGVSGVVSISAGTAAGFSSNDPVGTQPSGIDRTNYAKVYWVLTKTGTGSLTNYDATFDFSNASPGGTPSNYKLRNYTSSWANIASPSIVSNKISKTGLTAFGEFEAGEANALAVSTQPSNTSACDLAATSFTAASTSLPAPTIQWQQKVPAGSFTNISNGGVYSNVTTGTVGISNVTGLNNYEYQAVFTNINGTATSSAATLTVNALPAVTNASGGGTFCGSSTTITASGGSGGTIYFQGTTSGGTSTSTASTSEVVSASGTYYFRSRSAAGCWGTEGSVTVTLNPIPAVTNVSGAGTFCGSTTITASGGLGGTIYFQGTTSGGTSTSTASTSEVVSTSGTYYFRSRSAAGCWGTEGSVTVTINPNPAITNVSGAGTFCGSTTITASGGSGGTIYFQGATSGGTSTSTASTSEVVSTSGTYYFRSRSAAGCWGTEGSVTVIINAVPAALNLSGSSICSNNDGTGTISSTTSGANTINYQLYDGTNTPVQSPKSGTNAALTWNSLNIGSGYYVIGTGTGGCNSTSNTADVAAANNVWTGSNSNFNNASNWSCGVVPTSGSSIVINSGSGKVTLDTDFDVTGSFDFNANTAGDTLIIGAGVELKATGGTIDFHGNPVIIRSTAAGTGSIGQMTTALQGASNVTVERFTAQNAYRGWRMLAIPTQSTQKVFASWQESGALDNGFGTLITSPSGAAGYDAKTPSWSLLSYNPGLVPSWSGATAATNTINIVNNARAWMVYIRGNRTVGVSATDIVTNSPARLRTTGALRTGNQDVNLVDGFNLVGNPFASEIDFNNISVLSGSIDNTLQLWDPKVEGLYKLGNFVYFSGGLCGGCGVGSSYEFNQSNSKIESGMAFIVKSNGASQIRIAESAKTSGKNVNGLGFRPQAVPSLLVTGLYPIVNNLPVYADGTTMAYSGNFSNTIDGNDAVKTSNFGENISMVRDTKLLAIERRSLITDKDSIFYKITGLKTAKYRLELKPSGMDTQGLTAVLEDKYLSTSIPIDLGAVSHYDFDAVSTNIATFTDRFRIVFKIAGVTPVTISSFKAQQKDATIKVEWNASVENGVKQYEVERSQDGVSFSPIATLAAAANNGAAASYSFTDESPKAGVNYYRIKTVDLSGTTKYTNVVKVTVVKIAAGISLISTMIADNKIAIRLDDQMGGKYFVKLTNLLGQKFLKTSFEHTEGSNTQNITIPTLNKGTYLLEIITPVGKKIIEKVVMN
ncbi:hypothetical protein ACQ33O_13170 [Ferruginibacter sp. SUN002]|uniref:hypothetical protein n=1 Tax=Ferruginibacter sp. SUN002 TaxID=2937789 RepID=UPI003D36DE17